MTAPLVHLVDDDDAIRDALAWLLTSRGIASQGHQSAEVFLTTWHASMAGCVVLDMRLGGMTGLDCFDQLCARQSRLPVLFLTGHGDVPLAVAALKKGAFDFFEKPFNDNDLVRRIEEALALDARQRADHATVDTVRERLSRLTSRERQIMDLVVTGKYNKVIADELGISMRTVEVHRANLFEKMGVKTAVELANLIQGTN